MSSEGSRKRTSNTLRQPWTKKRRLLYTSPLLDLLIVHTHTSDDESAALWSLVVTRSNDAYQGPLNRQSHWERAGSLYECVGMALGLTYTPDYLEGFTLFSQSELIPINSA